MIIKKSCMSCKFRCKLETDNIFSRTDAYYCNGPMPPWASGSPYVKSDDGSDCNVWELKEN